MNDESSFYKVSSTFAPTEDFKIGWMNSSAVLLYATGCITLTLSIKKIPFNICSVFKKTLLDLYSSCLVC